MLILGTPLTWSVDLRFFESSRRIFPLSYNRYSTPLMTEPAHLWIGEDRLNSTIGLQQGDPLSPLLFAAAPLSVAEALKTFLQTT